MTALTRLPAAGSSRIKYKLISVFAGIHLLRVDCQRLQRREEMSADPYGVSWHCVSHSRQALFRLSRQGGTGRPSDPDVPYRR